MIVPTQTYLLEDSHGGGIVEVPRDLSVVPNLENKFMEFQYQFLATNLVDSSRYGNHSVTRAGV